MLILDLLGGGKINITGALTDGANIGITVLTPTDNSPVTVTSGYNTYNSVSPDTYFSLDKDGQIQTSPFDYMTVVMGWNEDRTEVAVGTALYTVNFDMNGHGDAINAVSLLSGYKVAEPTATTADGWYFVSWFTDDACTTGNEWNFDNAVTSNMTLHALWTQEAIYSIILPENMVIVSTDKEAVGGKYPVGTVIKFKLSSADHVVDGDVKNGDDVLTTDGDGNYTVTMGDADITITATVKKAVEPNKTLSGSDNYTAQDGDVLTGSTSGTVTIASGAKITLSDVTITGGIVCEGTAEITLVGTNSVSGAIYKAGIQVGGSGTTLTIKGNGSLTANGGIQSAGIGLSRAWEVDAMGGDIVIEGGNITATGDRYGAGIGTGVSYGNSSDKTATIGNITIKGGSVRAIGGTDQSCPGSGIGKGSAFSYGHAVVGTITIYDDIDMVDASSISESIVYMHETTDVTESKADYFTIGEDGNRRLIVQKPVIADIPDQTYTGSEITPEPLVIAGSLNLTKGTDYVYSYTNNTNAGTATVRATFKGTYASLGYVEKTFRIIKLLTHSDITIDTIPDQTYSGSEICPEISVKDGETTLILGTDYTVECADNVSAGTANMTITGMGDYPGSISKTFEIIKAPLTITAKDKTIVYGDEPTNDGVEYSGFVGSDDASVLGGTLTYGYNYEILNDTGEYTITPNGLTADNYNITFVNGTLTVEPKRRKFAAVTIEEDQDGRTAVLDCSYDRDDEINLPEYEDGIVVKAIKVKRTFGINTPATIVLPFKLPTETRTNADFYDLYSVEQVGNTWKARMEKIPDGHIQPLHPYAIIVYEEELTFDLQGKHVTVYMDENEIDTVKSQDKLWYFVGVYQYKTWGGDEDKELGLAYAFAGRNEHNIAKGQFGKIAAGGYAYPLRAYLRKKDASVQLKPVQNRPLASGEQRAASVASLFNEDNIPETIEVEFFEKDQNGEEHTTFIGRMDTRTGEFSSIRPSRTFDLKGRHVGKPKAKGAYFKK
ncbi:MAG: InlB B-repeat-containing protein [Fibrobacter sp.]|nr:InlB B-repeat-containing protein [Fibrobacter sp.]